LAVKFKVPAGVIAQGFVGYADLATGPRVYSAPEKVNAGLAELQSEIMKIAMKAKTSSLRQVRR
jgi:hypothetical protein